MAINKTKRGKLLCPRKHIGEVSNKKTNASFVSTAADLDFNQ